jgi:hypothetical protein
MNYHSSFGVGMEIATDAMVHVRVHLVAWILRVTWGSKECTREVVIEGVEYLVEEYAGAEEWLERFIIIPLL